MITFFIHLDMLNNRNGTFNRIKNKKNTTNDYSCVEKPGLNYCSLAHSSTFCCQQVIFMLNVI